MSISAVTVHLSGISGNTVRLEEIEFDDKDLSIKVAAYNNSTGSNITVEQLKNGYCENDETFKAYNSWYFDDNRSIYVNDYYHYVKENIKLYAGKNLSIDDITTEELTNILAIIDEAIIAIGATSIHEADEQTLMAKIEEIIKNG